MWECLIRAVGSGIRALRSSSIDCSLGSGVLQAHGWTLRGDDKDPKVGDAAKDAFARALKWFQTHL